MLYILSVAFHSLARSLEVLKPHDVLKSLCSRSLDPFCLRMVVSEIVIER
jgi:hypothetical protein